MPKAISFPKSADVRYDPGSVKTVVPHCTQLVRLHSAQKIPSHIINSYMGGNFAPNKKDWFISPIQLAKAAIRNHHLGSKIFMLDSIAMVLAVCILLPLALDHQELESAGKSSPATLLATMALTISIIGCLLFSVSVGVHFTQKKEDDQGNSFSKSADCLKDISRLVELVGEEPVISSDPQKLYLAAYEYCLKQASAILLQKADIADRKKSLIVSGNNKGLEADEARLTILIDTFKSDHNFFVKTFNIDHLFYPDYFYDKAGERLETARSIFMAMKENRLPGTESAETAS